MLNTQVDTILISIQAELDKAKQTDQNDPLATELTNALVAIRNLIQPWIKAFRPQEP